MKIISERQGIQMVLKELKKIFSNKWIAFLLVILCGINILLNVQVTEAERESIAEERVIAKQAIENYETYLENIKENAELLAGFDLFSEDSEYQKENGKKTVEAYENLKNIKLVDGNYTIISKFTDLSFSDVIILILIIQCAIMLIHTDQNKGMLTLLKSCRDGRIKLVLSKIAALLIANMGIVAVVLGTTWMSLYLTYGCDDLQAPLQSVMDYYESAKAVTIGDYLAMFCIIKITAYFLCSLIIFTVAVVVANVGLVYCVVSVIVAISFFVSANIMWDYALVPLKILSIITMIDVKSFTCRYYNINFFEIPINIFPLICSVIAVGILLFAIIATVLFCSNWKLNITIDKFKCLNVNRKMFLKGLHIMEWKKLLVTNKGILIIAVLIVLQVFVVGQTEYEMESLDKYYSNYMKILEGPVSQKTDNYINSEAERFEKIKKNYETNLQKYMDGQIDQQVMHAIEEEYDREMYPYVAFEWVLERDAYLKELKSEKGIEGQFFDDMGTNYLINPQLVYKENMAWLFMMVTMILLVVLCMGYEELTGMEHLLSTTLLGNRKLFRVKMWVTIFATTLVFAISNIPYLVLICQNYSFSGIDAVVSSLPQFENMPINISVMTYLFGLYTVKFLITLAAMLVAVFISRKCKGYIKKIAYSLVVIVVPLIICTIIK